MGTEVDDKIRIRLYLSGRVLVTEAKTGKVLEDFVVDDPRAAQDVIMRKVDALKRGGKGE